MFADTHQCLQQTRYLWRFIAAMGAFYFAAPSKQSAIATGQYGFFFCKFL
jgi:hypothetical protein